MFVVLNWIKTPYTFGLSYFVQFSKVYFIRSVSRFVFGCRSNFYIISESQVIVNSFLKVFSISFFEIFQQLIYHNLSFVICQELFWSFFSIESSFTSGSFLTTQLSYHVISNMSTTYFLLFNKLLVFFWTNNNISTSHVKVNKKMLIYQHF